MRPDEMRSNGKMGDEYDHALNKVESLTTKLAAVKICYETLKTILEENGGCPACGGSVFLHRGECEMYEVLATLREIVEG